MAEQTKTIELADTKPVNGHEVKSDVKTPPTTATGRGGDSATFSQLFSQADYLDYVLMFFGSLGSIVTGVSIPFFNVLFGRMIDALNTDPNSFEDRIKGIALAFVGVAAINLVSGLLQVCCWSISGERQTQKMRERYVRAILSQEIGWFDDVGASELATKVAELIGRVEDGIGRKLADLIQYLSQFIAAFIVGFYLGWKLTLVLLSAIPLIGGAGAFMISAVTAATSQSLEQYAAAGGVATEALGAIRTVTAINAQPDIITKYRKYLLDAMRVGIVKGFKVGLGNGLLFCVCFLTYALGFWYGGKLVADDIERGCYPGSPVENCTTGGTVLAVFFSVIMGSIALGQIAPPVASFFAAKAAAKPIFELIDRKPLIDGLSDEGIKPETKSVGAIELKDVHFAYPTRPSIYVCKGYNLSIKPGESVALVGASGCGKSTIMNLVLRFYDPHSGVVTLDGIDIRTLNTRWLRSQIGYVGQEPVLFNGSIRDNIAYGLDLIASDMPEGEKKQEWINECVIAAAKLANAHEFIMNFPQGYDTDVGSSGVAMSGGQKQRIAIARAIVKKPSVLLLDEATSALDAASERVVQQAIDSLQKTQAQTTLIIAHRLSTIRNASKIAAVSEGVIKELGTHDELIAKDGIYADLVRLQVSALEGMPEDEQQGAAEGQVEGESDKGGVEAQHITVTGTEEVNELDSSAVGGRKRSISNGKAVEQGVVTRSDNKKAPTTEKEVELDAETLNNVNGKVRALLFSHPIYLFIGILGAATFGGIFPCWGLLLAKTQNMFFYFESQKVRDKASELACYYILMAVISVLSATLQFWGIAQVGERISMKLRSEMFESILRREISFFDREENETGALTTRLSDDSRIVHKATGEAVAKIIQACFTLIIGMGIGLSASWKIALVVLATFPINIAASAVQMQAVAGQQYDNEGKEGNGGDGSNGGQASHGAVISSAFTHMRTVAAFSMQYKVANDYSALTKKISDSRMNRSYMAAFGFGASNTSLFCTYALLFWYGSTLIGSKEVDFEQMMTAILCLMLGALGLGTALTDLGDQKAGLKAAYRIFQAVDEGKRASIDGLSAEGDKPTTRPKGRIELKNVNFKYPTRPDAEVCKNYNLVIEPGQVVALVGPSGSGKSTIMSLLLRFYNPDSGEILLDGVNINSLNVRWLRSQIGYVGQEPVLFEGSISDNVAKGRADYGDTKVLSLEEVLKASDAAAASSSCCSSLTPSPTKYDPVSHVDVEAPSTEPGSKSAPPPLPAADIIEACMASNAHDFISTFSNGYDTDVGEGSIMISGGQKQRIAIARAIVKKPSVLLLDEATSALDAASEKAVQQSIDALQQSHSQTTIVIAHRLSTIKNADKIVVISKGEVVEQGTHDELLVLNGLYAQLWDKQKGLSNTGSKGSLNNLAAMVEK